MHCLRCYATLLDHVVTYVFGQCVVGGEYVQTCQDVGCCVWSLRVLCVLLGC